MRSPQPLQLHSTACRRGLMVAAAMQAYRSTRSLGSPLAPGVRTRARRSRRPPGTKQRRRQIRVMTQDAFSDPGGTACVLCLARRKASCARCDLASSCTTSLATHHRTSTQSPYTGTSRDSSAYVPPASNRAPLAGVTQAEYCRMATTCLTAPCVHGQPAAPAGVCRAPPTPGARHHVRAACNTSPCGHCRHVSARQAAARQAAAGPARQVLATDRHAGCHQQWRHVSSAVGQQECPTLQAVGDNGGLCHAAARCCLGWQTLQRVDASCACHLTLCGRARRSARTSMGLRCWDT